MVRSDRHPGVRPRASLGRRLDSAARISFPTCATFLLMLLTTAPLGIAAQPPLLPAVAIGCVWFWSLVQPDYLPPPAVFVIGLLLDLLGYLPPGAGVLTLLCCHGVALRLRQVLAQRGFALAWLAFIPVAAGAALLIWLLVMLLTFRLLSPEAVVFQAILSVAIYPVIAVPLAAAQRSITSAERA
ncbi:rod shape-determining protein MreD [Rhodopila sp.]|uniref:rod shape-determining protein MreD n=1 Tax=Rhodopila sp. TaxID=2480087 RepID=UPI003D0A9974